MPVMPTEPVEEDEIIEEPVVECEEEEEFKEEELEGGFAMFDEDGEEIIRTREELNELMAGADTMATRGLAVKPFLGVVKVAPSNAPAYDPSLPSMGLNLDFVHGYRCHDSRNNLVTNSQGNLVYPAAALVITMDPETREQNFFTGHNDDILCLAQNPADIDVVVTGQIATTENGLSKPPSICIYNTVTQSFHRIDNAGQRAIRCVAFSPTGRYFASAECDDKYTITVWDASTYTKVASAPTACKTALQSLVWNPIDDNEFVSLGSNHVTFWTLNPSSGKLTGKSGMTGIPQQLYISGVYSATGNQTLIGAKDGGVYVFVRGVAKKVFRIHKGKVNTLIRQGKHFVTGGDDKRVCVLDNSLSPVWQAEFDYQIRSLYTDECGDLTVGTRGSEIYQLPYDIQQPQGVCLTSSQLPAPVMRGHFDGEVWGVAPHPTKEEYATVGEDNQVIVWDAKKKQALRVAAIATTKGRFPKVNQASTTSSFPVNQMARAIAYSPNGQHIAIGTNEGVCVVFEAATLTQVASVDLNKHGKRQITNQSQNWIEVMQYSPSGKTLAVGTHGICICLLNVNKKYAVEHVFKEHTAAPLQLDFSADGRYMRSVSLSYELLYHSIEESALKESKHVTSATLMKDITWATCTVKFDWSVMGTWQTLTGSEAIDFSYINGVDVSPSRSLIAVGNDDGVVNVFKYPCFKPNATDKPVNKFRTYRGHSSHIPRVKFDNSEKYLFSTGGEDKCVFQWRVVKAGL